MGELDIYDYFFILILMRPGLRQGKEWRGFGNLERVSFLETLWREVKEVFLEEVMFLRAEIRMIMGAQPGKRGRWKRVGRIFQVEEIGYIKAQSDTRKPLTSPGVWLLLCGKANI